MMRERKNFKNKRERERWGEMKGRREERKGKERERT